MTPRITRAIENLQAALQPVTLAAPITREQIAAQIENYQTAAAELETAVLEVRTEVRATGPRPEFVREG